MKRPKTVKIQGHTYKIICDNSKECLDALKDGHTGLWGCIDSVKQKIYIDPNIPTDERWFSILLHECMHGFMQFSGLPDSEKVVFSLTNTIFNFLVENKLVNFDNGK